MTGTRFPDRATSRAVLIGTGSFHDPELPDIPAVQANLDALRLTLTHPVHGVFAPEHCVVVADPKDQATVGAALSQAVRESEDLLLVYYCGHGLLDEAGLLHFALTGTDHQNVSWSAIHLDLVKRMVGGARAKSRVLVLDCCFAGKAISAMAGSSGLALGQLNLTGTYTLTSTTATAPSHAPPGAAHTAFTGAMLEALTVPGPLTLDEVHRHVDRELAGLGLPRPQRRSVGSVGGLSLVRGPAKEPEKPPTGDAQASTEADIDSLTTAPTSLRRVWAWRVIPAITALCAMALLGNLLWGGESDDSSSIFGDDIVLVGLEGGAVESFFLTPAWGHFSAFNLDVVEGILKEVDTDLRPIRVDIQSSEQINSLQEGKVEVNAALAMTSQRMERLEFVGPIASGALGFMVRAGDESIKILADLKEKTVCAPGGSTGADIMKGYPQAQLIALKDPHSCIESLKKKNVDVVVGDTLPLSALALEDTELRIAPNVTIGAPSQYGIALPKGHNKDCVRLRDALVKYVDSGKWSKAFRDRLPNPAHRANELQPSATQINARSCRG
ncbi:transporter substrate-binding domain-containing protein [Streptomyces anulatus]|uniref:caspase, EACC1-associated type n=1 Tax=Streptomyces anulatus TaxID=1892 RepID=UPI003431179E